MQSLGEILRYDDAHYLKYLSRKTQYLITRDKSEFIHRFWQHLIVEYHPRVVLPRLSAADKKTFNTLLKQFSRDTRAAMRPKYQKLENKIPWVLQHPEGGYFIPYEIIKTLMPQNNLVPQGHLFQLLYKCPKSSSSHCARCWPDRTARAKRFTMRNTRSIVRSPSTSGPPITILHG
jgi:hypothetical protein